MPREQLLTTNAGGREFVGQDYYQLYDVTYDGISGAPILTGVPLGQGILVEAYNETDDFKYNKEKVETYVRVRD